MDADRVDTKKTIAVDFDGVIHSYASGWTGEVPIDLPVEGAKRAIAVMRTEFRMVVFTCRALTQAGREATAAWLERHAIYVDEVTPIKPHAVLYIDDRAWRFNGDWAKVVRMLGHGVPKPWGSPASPTQSTFSPRCWACGTAVYEVTPDGRYAACGHAIPGGEAIV